MRDDYLAAALKVVGDPNILVNLVSARVKQLKRGHRALVESLEKLSPEDTALREVGEGKITFELAADEVHRDGFSERLVNRRNTKERARKDEPAVARPRVYASAPAVVPATAPESEPAAIATDSSAA